MSESPDPISFIESEILSPVSNVSNARGTPPRSTTSAFKKSTPSKATGAFKSTTPIMATKKTIPHAPATAKHPHSPPSLIRSDIRPSASNAISTTAKKSTTKPPPHPSASSAPKPPAILKRHRSIPAGILTVEIPSCPSPHHAQFQYIPPDPPATSAVGEKRKRGQPNGPALLSTLPTMFAHQQMLAQQNFESLGILVRPQRPVKVAATATEGGAAEDGAHSQKIKKKEKVYGTASEARVSSDVQLQAQQLAKETEERQKRKAEKQKRREEKRKRREQQLQLQQKSYGHAHGYSYGDDDGHDQDSSHGIGTSSVAQSVARVVSGVQPQQPAQYQEKPEKPKQKKQESGHAHDQDFSHGSGISSLVSSMAMVVSYVQPHPPSQHQEKPKKPEKSKKQKQKQNGHDHTQASGFDQAPPSAPLAEARPQRQKRRRPVQNYYGHYPGDDGYVEATAAVPGRGSRSRPVVPKRKKKGRKAPAQKIGKTARAYYVENALDPDTKVEILMLPCQWGDEEGGCKAKLQNLETLRRHVYIVHGVRGQWGWDVKTEEGEERGLVCEFARCGRWRKEKEREKKGMNGKGKGVVVRGVVRDSENEDEEDEEEEIGEREEGKTWHSVKEWEEHIQEEHLVGYSWYSGDGNMNTTAKMSKATWESEDEQDGQAPLPLPKWLCRRDGKQVTPHAGDVEIEDRATAAKRKQQLEDYLKRVWGDLDTEPEAEE